VECFNIPLNKIPIVLRDDNTNIVAGVTESRLSSLSHFIHTSQLVISDAILLSQRSVQEILTVYRNIALHLNHSPSAITKFELLQTQVGVIGHKLKQDVKIRWNSTNYMLEFMLLQKEGNCCLQCRPQSHRYNKSLTMGHY